MSVKSLLIADGPIGVALARIALADKYKLTHAATLERAKQALIDSRRTGAFDLVLTGLQFDDSRMIELLQYIRNTDGLDSVAFLPVQTEDSGTDMCTTLNITLCLLGSHPILCLQDKTFSDSCDELMNSVQSSLAESVCVRRRDGHIRRKAMRRD